MVLLRASVDSQPKHCVFHRICRSFVQDWWKSAPFWCLKQAMDNAARHIVICLHDFYRGGTERVALGMARHWLARGRKVTILCGSRQGGLEDGLDSGVEVVVLSPPIARGAFSRIRLAQAMARKLAQIGPDLIFLPGNFHFPLIPALGKVRARAALVAKLSNPAVPSGAFAFAVRWYLARISPHIDGFAAMNRGLQQEMLAVTPEVPVAMLYDPVCFADAPQTRKAASATKEIVWAGRFEPQKDVPLALQTVAALADRMPVRLTLLGDGRLRPAMEAMAQRLGLEGKVRFMGHVPSIDAYLRSADALLVSSVYEGGPAVALEALAQGVPVVSTPCSALLREVMTIPEAGRIVDHRSAEALADALGQVLAAPRPEAAQLHALVGHLAPDACADAYLAWFDTRVASRRG